ncbi:MAG: hypothetical protein WC001_04890 [Desulfurivibrionaceae bacterium]
MKINNQAPIVDGILESWRMSLGGDFTAYNNHCYRVLNFCLAFCDESTETINKISIAVAFHDLGIWANNTFDYLGPSKQLARDYLLKTNLGAWSEEIEAMIEQHHKLRKYRPHPNWLVEPFRKADWIDVSGGRLKYGLPSAQIAEIRTEFPSAGFYKRLIELTMQRLKTHPLSPLPMMRL